MSLTNPNPSQKLPNKENAIFKKVARCYETKQHKTGLKYCRQILNNPKLAEHGETWAMKGLLLNCVGRKEEADECVRKGLRLDIQSPVCWHVYGLVQRSNRKYEEAVKCFQNATKRDSDNVQILRDLSMVYLQLREKEGFRDMRYKMLKLRPSQQSSWIGYSMAYYFLEDYSMALKIMSEYRKTMNPNKAPNDYSEIVLFEVDLMMKCGKHEEALSHIIQFEPDIFDVLGMAEAKAAVYMKRRLFGEASKIYRTLIDRNPENYSYHHKLEECLMLDSVEARLEHYKQLASDFPRSHVIGRMPLLISTGDVFKGLIDNFLRNSLRKGIPTIHNSIKIHYQHPEKVKIIEDLLSGYLEALKECEKLELHSAGPTEPPSTQLWTLVLLAQHYDIVGGTAKAMELIDEAIEHTPTDMQLYMIKAKIYKHGGDLVEASKWMEEARILDTADRFVNCKCVKYLFRVNQVERAIEVAGLFTREGPPTLETMDDMQCMWFQTELAHAYHCLGKLGDALQKLHEINKHFADIIDDQFDFHSYTMRKVTLRAYLEVLKSEDNLRSHPYYLKAAKTAIEIYLFLHDNPAAKKGTMNGPVQTTVSEKTSAELKKAQRKERKAALKAQAKAQEEKKAEAKAHKNMEEKSSEDNKPKFDPKELLNTEKPLDVAIKFLKPLQQLSSGKIDSHLLAYSIHSRRRKFLLMLQSLRRALAIDPENGELHSMIVDFLLTYEAARDGLPGPVKQVIEDTKPSLTGGKSLAELNRDFLSRHEDSLEHVIPASPLLYRLQPDSKESAIDYITNLSASVKDRTLKNCLKVHKVLQSDAFGPPDPSVLKRYQEACSKLFPLATAFRPSSSETTPTSSEDSSLPSMKEVVPKNISAASGGAVVLKATALSSAAMSDLCSDIV